MSDMIIMIPKHPHPVNPPKHGKKNYTKMHKKNQLAGFRMLDCSDMAFITAEGLISTTERKTHIHFKK